LEQVRIRGGQDRDKTLIILKGPAHAVYFATYEAVKHAMGGNQAGVHHPLAAGMLSQISQDGVLLLTYFQPPVELAQRSPVMPS
jgi:hypothetical protein